MKVRKGQQSIKLKERIDEIHQVCISGDDGIWWNLIATEPQNILPFKPRIGWPEMFCFVNGEVRLDKKLNKKANLRIYGSKLIKQ